MKFVLAVYIRKGKVPFNFGNGVDDDYDSDLDPDSGSLLFLRNYKWFKWFKWLLFNVHFVH